MTAARFASPEGWQVSVSLVGVIGGASCGRVVWCWARLVVGSRVAESSLVDGPCGGQAVLGGLVVAALVVVLAGVMKVAVVIVRWCRSGSWERGWCDGTGGGC
jgi:hypothetical protein